MDKITESSIEQYSIDLLEKQGFTYIYGPEIAPDSETPARQNFDDVLLLDKLKEAIARINPKIDPDQKELDQKATTEDSSVVQIEGKI